VLLSVFYSSLILLLHVRDETSKLYLAAEVLSSARRPSQELLSLVSLFMPLIWLSLLLFLRFLMQLLMTSHHTNFWFWTMIVYAVSLADERSWLPGVLLLDLKVTSLAALLADLASLWVTVGHNDAFQVAGVAELTALLERARVLIDDRSDDGVRARRWEIRMVVLRQWKKEGTYAAWWLWPMAPWRGEAVVWATGMEGPLFIWSTGTTTPLLMWSTGSLSWVKVGGGKVVELPRSGKSHRPGMLFMGERCSLRRVVEDPEDLVKGGLFTRNIVQEGHVIQQEWHWDMSLFPNKVVWSGDAVAHDG
jgi:hypothetical protein